MSISDALGQRLDDANLGYQIAWPNKKSDDPLKVPYLIYEYVPTSRRDHSLAGGSAIARGYVQISVVTKKNTFEADDETVANAVTNVFDRADPAKAVIIDSGLKIKMGDSQVLRSYPDAVNWRTPVRIQFTAFKA